MHPHDKNCRWCGAELYAPRADGDRFWPPFIHTSCQNKPPQTPEDGAAVAFGLMGMAEAIRTTYLRIVEVSGWECFDECSRCGIGRCESEVPLLLKGDHFLCEVCNGE